MYKRRGSYTWPRQKAGLKKRFLLVFFLDKNRCLLLASSSDTSFSSHSPRLWASLNLWKASLNFTLAKLESSINHSSDKLETASGSIHGGFVQHLLCARTTDNMSQYNESHLPERGEGKETRPFSRPPLTAPGRLRQEDPKFQTSLGYIASSRQVWRDPDLRSWCCSSGHRMLS